MEAVAAVSSAIAASLALIVSIVVYAETRARERRNAQLGRRPALVFRWDDKQHLWELSNIGSGPALDVVVLQRVSGQWGHPLRMWELAADGKQSVPRRWVEAWDTNPGLGARYRSAVGEPYSTRTANDWSQLSEGWTELEDTGVEIEPHWRYRDGARSGS